MDEIRLPRGCRCCCAEPRAAERIGNINLFCPSASYHLVSLAKIDEIRERQHLRPASAAFA